MRRLGSRQLEGKRPSQRFRPTRWTEFLVPALLVLLLVILIAILLLVVLSMLGLTPSV